MSFAKLISTQITALNNVAKSVDSNLEKCWDEFVELSSKSDLLSNFSDEELLEIKNNVYFASIKKMFELDDKKVKLEEERKLKKEKEEAEKKEKAMKRELEKKEREEKKLLEQKEKDEKKKKLEDERRLKKEKEEAEKKQKEEAQLIESVKSEVEQKKKTKELEKQKSELSLSEFDRKFREINRLKIRVNALLRDKDFYTDKGLSDWAKSELAELNRLEKEYNITDEDQQQANLQYLIGALAEENSYITEAENELKNYRSNKQK